MIGEDVCQWVVNRTGGTYYADSGQGIGWAKEGKLVAGVMFDNYNVQTVQMHVAAIGKHWMTREYLHYCFSYPFKQLCVKKIIGLVDSTNADAMKFDLHLGFIQEAQIKDAGKHGDLNILTMTRQQCRFIKDKKLCV